MNKIKEAIAQLAPDRQPRIEKAIEALDNGRVTSLEFSGDGSCVTLTYLFFFDVNGVPATVASTLSMDEAALALAGHRLRSHELPQCA